MSASNFNPVFSICHAGERALLPNMRIITASYHLFNEILNLKKGRVYLLRALLLYKKVQGKEENSIWKKYSMDDMYFAVDFRF